MPGKLIVMEQGFFCMKMKEVFEQGMLAQSYYSEKLAALVSKKEQVGRTSV